MLRKFIIFAASCGLTASVHAEDIEPRVNAVPQGMRSVFIEPKASAEEKLEEEEWSTDMDLFLAQGYIIPRWDTYADYVDQIANDLIIPEYLRRTGRSRPEFYSIDVAAAMITHGDFNDLIVRSRLPGDCDDKGCLVQIYSLVGKMWVKKFEFKSLEFAYKNGETIGTTKLALIGNEFIPSRTVIFDGSKFNVD